jgi:FKBP-type peptidyl-prolyl cis-trans isomerase FkpA
MHKTISALLLAAVAITWGCEKKDVASDAAETEATAPAGRTEDEKTIYALGAMLGERAVQPLQLSPAEVEILVEGLSSTATGGKPEVSIEEYGPKFQAFAQARAAAAAAEQKQKSQGFLENAAKEEGAEKTDSGLIYRPMHAGQGASPVASDVVTVHYHGTLTDGTVFDSSRERGEPARFALNEVIPCWTEGVQKMKVGETAQLVCPADIAYGDRPSPGIPPGSTLVFEVELIGIEGK